MTTLKCLTDAGPEFDQEAIENLVRATCNDCLKGSIWNPKVEITKHPNLQSHRKYKAGWYWRDERSDDETHGPFPSCIEAGLDAISYYGLNKRTALDDLSTEELESLLKIVEAFADRLVS